MTRLAHATAGAPGLDAEKRELADIAQHEIAEARRIQTQTGCSWTEALRLAYQHIRKESA
jgi:hypothetical protein